MWEELASEHRYPSIAHGPPVIVIHMTHLLTSQMLGVAKGALDSVLPYILEERKAFGQPVGDFQVLSVIGRGGGRDGKVRAAYLVSLSGNATPEG